MSFHASNYTDGDNWSECWLVRNIKLKHYRTVFTFLQNIYYPAYIPLLPKIKNVFADFYWKIMAGQMDVGAILGEQLLNAAKIMEEQVDQEIANLEKMDEDDIEVLRRRRMGK